jgi:hypothetical protein
VLGYSIESIEGDIQCETMKNNSRRLPTGKGEMGRDDKQTILSLLNTFTGNEHFLSIIDRHGKTICHNY